MGSLGAALKRIRAGGLVAYPTETVWGLAADATSEKALAALRSFKGRGEGHPVAILVDGVEALGLLDFEVGDGALRLADKFWPGPLTLVLRCGRRLAAGVAGINGAVGVRCSNHPLARSLASRLREEGMGPITATSLNVTGEPPARTRRDAARLCGAEEEGGPLLLDTDGAEAGGEEPSTVVDLTGPEPQVLRWGAIPAGSLLPFIEETSLA